MNPIGGFFELETSSKCSPYHCTGNLISLNTGRASLNYILRQIHPRKLYLPFYICDSMVSAVQANNIDIQYYPLDKNLDPVIDFSVDGNECIIYVNYFGLKTVTVKNLIRKFGSSVIVDNVQAFFEKNYEDVWSFNSVRKWFGVPDGSYIYSPEKVHIPQGSNNLLPYDHLIERAVGNLQRAFRLYQKYEKSLDNSIKSMSGFTEILLQAVDYDGVRRKRRNNFRTYDKRLNSINQLSLSMSGDAVPFCYPFLPKKHIDRKKLFKKNIFIPRYWEDVYRRKGDNFVFEKHLSDWLLPLPVDHRYGEEDLGRVVQEVKSLCI